MTLQQLKYALMVAETGSFNEAARRLYVSQPSLSFAIKGLEDELGITIFVRSHKGTIVSERGKEFLKKAKQILLEFELLSDDFRADSSSRQRFSVSSQHYTFVSEAFARLVKFYDGIEYEMVLNESTTLEVLEDVKNLRSELGILYISKINETAINKILKEGNLVFTELFTTFPYILVGDQNPLAEKDRVDATDLAEYASISFGQEDLAPDWFSEEIINILRQKRSVKISDRGALADLLLSTNAYVVSTGVYMLSSGIRKTVAIPFDAENESGPIRLGYINHKEIKYTPMAETFINYLNEIIKNYAPHEHTKRYF